MTKIIVMLIVFSVVIYSMYATTEPIVENSVKFGMLFIFVLNPIRKK